MIYAESQKKINDLRQQILKVREQIRAVQSNIEPQPVENYTFTTLEGEVSLLNLFGDKTDLFLVHNMGKSCTYCTLWADGCNGVYDHLADRAAFVLSSPDSPAVQQAFATERHWRFPMVSHTGTSFAKDMGYVDLKGGMLPGVSAFQRRGDRIIRVTDTPWGPGDDFCSVWHFCSLLPEGAANWSPKLAY